MHDKFHYMRYMHRTLLLLLLLILILLVLSLHAVHALQSAAHHEGVEVRVGSAQLVHDPLDLAKAEGPPLPVLAIQGHIGPIYQGLHRPMLLQPRLNHTTESFFKISVWEVGWGGVTQPCLDHITVCLDFRGG